MKGRRSFVAGVLLALVAGALALVLRLRHEAERRPAVGDASPIEALLVALGPWAATERAVALALARKLVQRGLPPAPAPATVRRLAERAERALAGAKPIELSDLPAEDKRWLLALLASLYTTALVRSRLLAQPPPGACGNDPLAYTRAPAR